MFPDGDNILLFEELENNDNDWYQKRIDVDVKIFEKAKKLGYDAIVLMNPAGKKDLERNKKPRSIELNLVRI